MWKYWRRYGGNDAMVDGYLRRDGRVTEIYDPSTRSWAATNGAYLDRVIAQGDPMYEPVTERVATAGVADLTATTTL